MKTIKLIMAALCCPLYMGAQISTDEVPPSFQYEDAGLRMTKADVVKAMPELDMRRIEKEDLEDSGRGIPPRFGYLHKVNYTIDNSGSWYDLPDGDRIWRLGISCPNALSINLLYDKFWLPEGGKLFVYGRDRKHVTGAFTSDNNKGDRHNIQGFATGLVYSDDIVVEYHQPREVKEPPVISIGYVVHGYRYIKSEGFGDSGNCQLNVNCPEGGNWKDEKNAVALILVHGNRYCTGSLVNTTANDYGPYLLTADHCLVGWENNRIKYDAISNPDLSHFSFYWHYESPACTDGPYEPPYISTSGATVVANNGVSDFALLRLTEDPKDKSGVVPYYLGWDRSGSSGTGGVGIHHPNGDVKKISTYAISPFSSDHNMYNDEDT